MRYALVLILCIGFSPLVNAQQRGGYVGISGGAFTFEDDEAGITAADIAWSYGLFGGYRFSDSFAIEGSWGKTTDFSDLFDDIVQQLPIIRSFLPKPRGVRHRHGARSASRGSTFSFSRSQF
jgi:hypothetical protein